VNFDDSLVVTITVTYYQWRIQGGSFEFSHDASLLIPWITRQAKV